MCGPSVHLTEGRQFNNPGQGHRQMATQAEEAKLAARVWKLTAWIWVKSRCRFGNQPQGFENCLGGL